MKYALPLLILFSMSGCATVRELNEPLSIGENSTSALPGQALAAPAAAAPRAGEPARKTDDFVEVDDEAGIRKTWPMALFIGLLALAAAAF